jgi:addiction module HigA family antidote
MGMRNPPHPGLVLREYLGATTVSQAAAHLRITRVTLSRVLNGKAGISAIMAIRLAAQYDLWRARQSRQPAVHPFPHIAQSRRSHEALRT